MSRGMTKFVGWTSVVLGLAFLLIPLAGPIPKPWSFVAISAVLFVIALACLLPKSRPVTVRVLAAIVLAGCILKFWEAFSMPAAPAAPVAPGAPTPPHPAIFLLVAIPCAICAAYFVVFGPSGPLKRWKKPEDVPAAFYTLPRFRRLPGDAKLRLGEFEVDQQQWNEIHKQIALRNHAVTPRWRHNAAALGFLVVILIGAFVGVVFGVPFWILFVAVMTLGSMWIYFASSPSRRIALRHRREVLKEFGYPVCLECGYNLTGVPAGDVCPECGWERAEVAPPTSR